MYEYKYMYLFMIKSNYYVIIYMCMFIYFT